jgi:hypothetical protein
MLSSNMLLPILTLPIDVTFSTPTPDYTQIHPASGLWPAYVAYHLTIRALQHRPRAFGAGAFQRQGSR